MSGRRALARFASLALLVSPLFSAPAFAEETYLEPSFRVVVTREEGDTIYTISAVPRSLPPLRITGRPLTIPEPGKTVTVRNGLAGVGEFRTRGDMAFAFREKDGFHHLALLAAVKNIPMENLLPAFPDVLKKEVMILPEGEARMELIERWSEAGGGVVDHFTLKWASDSPQEYSLRKESVLGTLIEIAFKSTDYKGVDPKHVDRLLSGDTFRASYVSVEFRYDPAYYDDETAGRLGMGEYRDEIEVALDMKLERINRFRSMRDLFGPDAVQLRISKVPLRLVYQKFIEAMQAKDPSGPAPGQKSFW